VAWPGASILSYIGPAIYLEGVAHDVRNGIKPYCPTHRSARRLRAIRASRNWQAAAIGSSQSRSEDMCMGTMPSGTVSSQRQLSGHEQAGASTHSNRSPQTCNNLVAIAFEAFGEEKQRACESCLANALALRCRSSPAA